MYQQQKEAVTETDGSCEWISWSGGECPVTRGTLVDVKYSDGGENTGVSAMTYGFEDDHINGSNKKYWAVSWYHSCRDTNIIAYRLHNKTHQE